MTKDNVTHHQLEQTNSLPGRSQTQQCQALQWRRLGETDEKRVISYAAGKASVGHLASSPWCPTSCSPCQPASGTCAHTCSWRVPQWRTQPKSEKKTKDIRKPTKCCGSMRLLVDTYLSFSAASLDVLIADFDPRPDQRFDEVSAADSQQVSNFLCLRGGRDGRPFFSGSLLDLDVPKVHDSGHSLEQRHLVFFIKPKNVHSILLVTMGGRARDPYCTRLGK